MRRSRGWNCLHLVSATILLAAATSLAHSDPISSDGYTITDLGPGTPTIGNGIVLAPNGQTAYSFPQSPNTVLTPGQGIAANFPQFPAMPGAYDYGNPAYDFNYVTSAIMNSNGLVAALDVSGVNGHEYEYTAFAIQRNADGSWGSPVNFAWSPEYWAGASTAIFGIIGLSNSNEILLSNSHNYNTPDQTLVYNAHTNSVTDLANVINPSGIDALNFTPVAIDDQGRILLTAILFNPNVPYPASYQATNLLLTPDGVSSDPIEMTVPEPSTLALMLLAMAGYAIRRVRRRDPIV